MPRERFLYWRDLDLRSRLPPRRLFYASLKPAPLSRIQRNEFVREQVFWRLGATACVTRAGIHYASSPIGRSRRLCP